MNQHSIFFLPPTFSDWREKKVKRCYKQQMTSTSVKVIWADFGSIFTRLTRNLLIFNPCAQDETRTHTVLRPLPPQSSVYTNFTTCAWVPRTGLEPARLSTLAPETSASTNSAIWAQYFKDFGLKKSRNLSCSLERQTRLELATPTLARSCSTN